MIQRKDGRYQQQVTVTVRGKPKQKYFYGKSQAEVLRKIAMYREEAAEAEQKGRPFQTVADEWWEEISEDLSPNTRRPYKAALNRARERFKDEGIRTITPADINAFLRQTIKKNKMADKTARTQLSVCNMIFRYAVQMGDLFVNPARDLEVPSGLEKNDRDMASEHDIKFVKESPDTTMGLMAKWFLYTGLRRSELLALTWEDVDMENRIVHVRRSIVREETGRIYAKEPKTEAGERQVPILDALAEHLKPGTGLVFPNAEGNYISENSFSKRWSNYQKETGITCTPHQLRHAATTMLCEAVADGKLTVEDVQHIIGHAQYQTTMDVYKHYRETQRKKAWGGILDIDIKV